MPKKRRNVGNGNNKIKPQPQTQTQNKLPSGKQGLNQSLAKSNLLKETPVPVLISATTITPTLKPDLIDKPKEESSIASEILNKEVLFPNRDINFDESDSNSEEELSQDEEHATLSVNAVTPG